MKLPSFKSPEFALAVGFFLAVYGAFHLLNGHAGDDATGLASLLFGLSGLATFGRTRARSKTLARTLQVIALAAFLLAVVPAFLSL
jgi:hypothetical protein